MQPPQRVPIGDLTAEQVAQAIGALGHQLADIDPQLLVVVRNAFDLGLFAVALEEIELGDGGVDMRGLRTRLDLLREVDKVFSRRLRASTNRTDYGSLVQGLAEKMSALGEPSLPAYMALAGEIEVKNALLDEGVLVEDRERTRFFHQSYFEYAFALGHLAAGRSATDLVRDDPQDLLRRGQVRALLALERQSQPGGYEAEARSLVTGTGVRAHIRAMVIDCLGDQDNPLACEIEVLRALSATPGDQLAGRARVALTRPGPAGALVREGLVQRTGEELVALLSGGRQGPSLWPGMSADQQLFFLVQVGRSYPEETSRALRSLAREPTAAVTAATRLLQVVFVAGPAASNETAGLFSDLASSVRQLVTARAAGTPVPSDLDEAVRTMFSHYGPSALENLAQRCPEAVLPALEEWLDLALSVVRAAGGTHIFDVGSPLPSLEGKLTNIADQEPARLASLLAPFLLDAMEQTRQSYGYSPGGDPSVSLHADTVWSFGEPLPGALLDATCSRRSPRHWHERLGERARHRTGAHSVRED